MPDMKRPPLVMAESAESRIGLRRALPIETTEGIPHRCEAVFRRKDISSIGSAANSRQSDARRYFSAERFAFGDRTDEFEVHTQVEGELMPFKGLVGPPRQMRNSLPQCPVACGTEPAISICGCELLGTLEHGCKRLKAHYASICLAQVCPLSFSLIGILIRHLGVTVCAPRRPLKTASPSQIEFTRRTHNPQAQLGLCSTRFALLPSRSVTQG